MSNLFNHVIILLVITFSRYLLIDDGIIEIKNNYLVLEYENLSHPNLRSVIFFRLLITAFISKVVTVSRNIENLLVVAVKLPLKLLFSNNLVHKIPRSYLL